MMTYDVLKPIVPLRPPRARSLDLIILHDPRGNFIAKRCSVADRHVFLLPPAHLSCFSKVQDHRSQIVTSLFRPQNLFDQFFAFFPFFYYSCPLSLSRVLHSSLLRADKKMPNTWLLKWEHGVAQYLFLLWYNFLLFWTSFDFLLK